MTGMELSIELFLLDNTLMNLLMLRLASAISGLKLRPFFGVAASLFGAALIDGFARAAFLAL